ncbi:MAG: CRISPR-associated ring nuclease Crn3/Csx3 [Oscillatoriaceae cyanobacterium Prado104]|jgi:CRISPR-associated protein Csx3|nr:CRISPR-associated ring nuclease Crn3/Csx3 [Oscillatoriaceae cyanobacterium Prado104]
MSAIELILIPHQTEDGLAYQHLRLRITTADGIITPMDLQGLKLSENVQYSQGIVLEGRGAIWLYGYLVHECHPAAWIGCYDPRLDGAVVVATHKHEVAIGQVLKLSLPS